MQMQMTERDKKLLVMLAIFVIVVCIGYWGIYPVIKDINNYKDEKIEQEELRDMNEIKLMQVPMLEVENEKMEETIVDSRNTYFKMMTADELDKYITNEVLDYGLYSYDLDISIDTEETTLEPYQYSQKAIYGDGEEIYTEDETESSDSDSDSESSDADTIETTGNNPETGIYKATITLRLGGEAENINKFVDDFSTTDKKIRVVKYSWTEERKVKENTEIIDEDADLDYEVSVSRVLNITMEIYMCEE